MAESNTEGQCNGSWLGWACEISSSRTGQLCSHYLCPCLCIHGIPKRGSRGTSIYTVLYGVCVLFIWCTHTVYAYCLYGVRIWCMYTVYMVYAYSVCILFTWCTHTVYAYCLFGVRIRCMHTVYMVYAYGVCIQYTVYVYVYGVCKLLHIVRVRCMQTVSLQPNNCKTRRGD